MTAEERAWSFVAQCMAGRKIEPPDRVAARGKLARMFKEQDRDTRHACTESATMIFADFHQRGYDFPHELENQIISAIMNTRSV